MVVIIWKIKLAKQNIRRIRVKEVMIFSLLKYGKTLIHIYAFKCGQTQK